MKYVIDWTEYDTLEEAEEALSCQVSNYDIAEYMDIDLGDIINHMYDTNFVSWLEEEVGEAFKAYAEARIVEVEGDEEDEEDEDDE